MYRKLIWWCEPCITASRGGSTGGATAPLSFAQKKKRKEEGKEEKKRKEGERGKKRREKGKRKEENQKIAESKPI